MNGARKVLSGGRRVGFQYSSGGVRCGERFLLGVPSGPRRAGLGSGIEHDEGRQHDCLLMVSK